MEIKYNDEPDLQRKLVQKLNHNSGFHFHKTKANYFCDIVDEITKIYIEVKPDDFAPAQLLYGLGKSGIESEYIGLANAFEIRLYKSPKVSKLIQFAKSIDPMLTKNPSSITKEEWNNQAYDLLGDFDTIYPYPFEIIFSMTEKIKHIFIDENNYEYFKKLFDKYQINPAQFLTFITTIYAKNNEIKINNDGRILELRKGTFYRNDDQSQQTLVGSGSITEYKPILNRYDKQLFEATRIKANDIQQIMHKIDELETISSRRTRGRFFTMDENHGKASDITTKLVLEMIHPTFILEPYVGSGSLIRPIILENQIHGVGNDINQGFINMLSEEFKGLQWQFTALNTITTPIDKLMINWKIPMKSDERILIYTNPPFGTGSTNQLASKKDELNKKASRNVIIDYGGLDAKYGKGDLLIPAIGKIIELIRHIGHGFIAFFCPLGVFCGRQRYNKLLHEILKNFSYHGGIIFKGSQFNGVSKNKPIAFTIWEYSPNINTSQLSLTFAFENQDIQLKQFPLLKDGWKYDTRQLINGEIAVQGNDRFNASPPKMIHLDIKKGGSELSPRNVKISLNISNIPDELIYGLWSLIVGLRSITSYPIYMDNSYVHLPDFTDNRVIQILSLTVLTSIIDEINHNYCQGKIGFIGVHRIFQFGNPSLTNGCNYLLNTHKDILVNETETIGSIFHTMQSEPDPLKWNKNWRKELKAKIEGLLNEIEYWKYIPIP